MRKKIMMPLALVLMLVLAACSGQQATETSQEQAAASQQEVAAASEDMAMEDTAEESQDMGISEMAEAGHEDDMDTMAEEGQEEGEEMAGDSESESMAASNLPEWQTIPLTNAATGEQFRLADFQGKMVFVEPMATWCSNCRQQQGHVREAKAQLGENVVFIGLSLETSLPPEQLASYAQGNGFDWTYAVLPVDLLTLLADEFGRSITSAPSTPHFLIYPDGSFSELSTGIHSSSEIIAEIESAQG